MASQPINFHDLLRLEIESTDPTVLAYFQAEYAAALGEVSADLPAVRLIWAGDSAGAPMKSTSHKLLARWQYRLDWLPNDLKVIARGNRTAIPMVHHMLVHHGLRYIGSQHGLLLLHAAALVREGRSLILTGHGGAGKTTTSSLMLAYGDAGWRLHADDYVFIGPGSQTYSYLTRAHLYLPLLGWIPELGARLGFAERFKLELLGRIRRISGDRLKWPVRLTADRLWPGRSRADQASLGALVLLERNAGSEEILEEIEPSAALVADMMELNFLEARHFRRLVETSPGGAPSVDWWDSWKRREGELLAAAIATIPCYRLRLPVSRRGSPISRKPLLAAIQSLMDESLS